MSVLEEVRIEVSGHMDSILECFKPGAKITVLVRLPGFPDQDFMLTSDSPDEAIALIERRKTGRPQ